MTTVSPCAPVVGVLSASVSLPFPLACRQLSGPISVLSCSTS